MVRRKPAGQYPLDRRARLLGTVPRFCAFRPNDNELRPAAWVLLPLIRATSDACNKKTENQLLDLLHGDFQFRSYHLLRDAVLPESQRHFGEHLRDLARRWCRLILPKTPL